MKALLLSFTQENNLDLNTPYFQAAGELMAEEQSFDKGKDWENIEQHPRDPNCSKLSTEVDVINSTDRLWVVNAKSFFTDDQRTLAVTTVIQLVSKDWTQYRALNHRSVYSQDYV